MDDDVAPRPAPWTPAGMAGRTGANHRAVPEASWLRAWCWMVAALHDFLYLVLPAECAVCGGPDQALCPDCAAEVRYQTMAPFRAETSADALMGVFGETYLPVVSAGHYRDGLAAAILAFKNHGRTELVAPLARCLARGLASCLDDVVQRPERGASQPLFLVPIPSTGNGWRRRGYDPVAMLLRCIVREGRLPAPLRCTPILRVRSRLPWHTHHQKGLGRSARRRNVRNTMVLRRRTVAGIRLTAKSHRLDVVLVDDVLTTGSTLQEAAKTLERAGLHVVAGVVLAAARAPEKGHELEPVERLTEN